MVTRKSRCRSSAPTTNSVAVFDSTGKKPVTGPRAAAASPTARDDLTATVAITTSRTRVSARIHQANPPPLWLAPGTRQPLYIIAGARRQLNGKRVQKVRARVNGRKHAVAGHGY